MNYKKISMGEYDIHLIKNKNFHTIDFRVFFAENVSKELSTYRNALVDILTYATNIVLKTGAELLVIKMPNKM